MMLLRVPARCALAAVLIACGCQALQLRSEKEERNLNRMADENEVLAPFVCRQLLLC
jgi:hypothetical protein